MTPRLLIAIRGICPYHHAGLAAAVLPDPDSEPLAVTAMGTRPCSQKYA